MSTFLRIRKFFLAINLIVLIGLAFPYTAHDDDTCVFGATDTQTVRPNIILLFDDGAEMNELAWTSTFPYDPTVDYTPCATPTTTAVTTTTVAP